MISKKTLLLLAIPMSITSAFAAVSSVPQVLQDLREINQPEIYVLRKPVFKSTKSSKLFLGTPENWFNLSPSQGVQGVRSEEAYETFGIPLSDDVVVAVIDSGVDVNHEDLQGQIWINKNEIPDNGIDDDQNGFVDDVFGWNFIGGSLGMAKIQVDTSLKNGLRLIKGEPSAQISTDTLEITRELVRMKKLKSQVEELGETLTAEQSQYLNKLQKDVDQKREEASRSVITYRSDLKSYKEAETVLNKAGLAEMTVDAVREFKTSDSAVSSAKTVMLELLSNRKTESRLLRLIKANEDASVYSYNENFNPRVIVGDSYTNSRESNYGNNDVIGPDARHGTHVAGIIAASRSNSLGVKGVATRVKIMAIRVVPNGDERDKDVANGIRYAVDNGARIINMSFGKAFSPYEKVVEEAIKYAEQKGVLMVHAAGNDSKNNDLIPGYPNRNVGQSEFSNWLEIGASSYQKGLKFAADFSNYGKKSVDFFAPGVDIFNTVPDNKYDTLSGTSMATPAVAGVAAMVMSYSPSLDAQTLIPLLLQTSRRFPLLKVYSPGTKTEVLFSTLSNTGTLVDVFEAINVLKNQVVK